MTCAHQLEPLATSPFQRAPAVWLMDYCKRCGERHWYVQSPNRGPITEDQPCA